MVCFGFYCDMLNIHKWWNIQYVTIGLYKQLDVKYLEIS